MKYLDAAWSAAWRFLWTVIARREWMRRKGFQETPWKDFY